MGALLLAHAAVTWCLTGLIWTIQLVHYPLFDAVGPAAFAAYHHGHTARITPLVVPLMLSELALAGLFAWQPPATASRAEALVGAALVAVVWGTTFFASVPAHDRLASGFDAGAYASLVGTNWIRTAAWTARALLASAWVWRAMRAVP